jgi:predicted ATPase
MLLEEGFDESDVREIVGHFENLGPRVMEDWLDLFRRIDTSHSNVFTLEDVLKVRWARRQRQETIRELEHEQSSWVSEQMPGQPTVPVMIPQRVPEPFNDAIAALDDYFSSRIAYLGPLREDPRTVYDLPQSGDPQDVGLKGEYTAAVLDANKNVEVEYWHTEDVAVKTGPLKEAVLHWLGYLGMAEDVATTEIGQQGYTLTITDSSVSKPLDLTNVGVGVSQVLPIIVKGLLSEPESTVIYEQPEIHLHPATQARIADFFIGLIRSGVQCIIETHSEYFINRMRLRIAEDENEDTQLSGLIQILFAERTAGQTSYRPVQVNEYGAIVNWPAGFFDQSQTESEDLLEAAMNKRTADDD